MSFESLQLPAALLQTLSTLGYAEPTPIQAQAIPLILAGHDLLGQSQTGTGKTAAFALPVLAFLSEAVPSGQAHTLVLAPTRELALQVMASFACYGQGLNPRPRVLALVGGSDSEAQLAALTRGVEVLVATPGRLLDILRQDPGCLKALDVLVLDEADKMLSLGFAEELEAIFQSLPAQRQTLLFSATFPDKVQALSQQMLHQPLTVRIDAGETSLATIQQRVIAVDREQRGRLLRHLLVSENWEHTLVFVASKRGAANLAAKLNKAGLPTLAFHGDLAQFERLAAVAAFESRQVKVLVATDLAARGLDFNQISHVVNFDLPRSPDDYLHRIGRTARAGKVGVALSLIDPSSQAHFALIEKRAGIQLVREQIVGFEPSAPLPLGRSKGAAPVKGRRPSKKDKARAAAQRLAVNSVTESDTRSER